jgi:hypothetical protein
LDIRDRFISLVAAAIFGIPAIALLFLALVNGVGSVIAHYDSARYHAARPCASQVVNSPSCISTQRVTVNDIFGPSFLITLPSRKTTLVEQAKLVLTPTVQEQGSTAAIKVWNGKIVELVYDTEIVETTENPDFYSQTWPVTLMFGLTTCVLTGLVFVAVSWATGYPVFGHR